MLDEIPGFPQYLMDRHMNWHSFPGDPSSGGRAILPGQPGSGAEFLDFHHQYIIDFKAWYGTQAGHDDTKIAPWPAFPADLVTAHPTLSNFQQTASDGSSFASEDALGLYIEPTHNSVHGWVAQLYGEPGFGGFDSCKYFMFYQWHGMLDDWRNHWLSTHKQAISDVKVIIDHPKIFIKDQIDIKIKDLIDALQPIPNIPIPKPKDAEVPGPGVLRDPGIAQLASRLGALEATVATQQAFIRQQERPAVE